MPPGMASQKSLDTLVDHANGPRGCSSSRVPRNHRGTPVEAAIRIRTRERNENVVGHSGGALLPING